MISSGFARSLISTVAFGFSAVLSLPASEPASPVANAAAATTPAAADTVALDEHTLEKRTAPILKDLKLTDKEQEAKLRAILQAYFEDLAKWHRQQDDRLNELWSKWADARATAHKDEAKANAVGAQIDEVYASFRPQHDEFLHRLAAILSPADIEHVKDALTKSPGFQRTYDAYLQIVPALTDAQKTFIREKLMVAREQAVDAITNKEKADLFKKQKVQIEAYIDAQGYDWKKSYAVFAKKMKGQSDAAKAGESK